MLVSRTQHNILTGNEADNIDLFEDIFNYMGQVLAKKQA